MLGSQGWVLGSGFRDWVLSAVLVLGTRFRVLSAGFSVLGSQCWVLGSGFRDRVLSAGFSGLGTRFWIQGLGSQCCVSTGY